MKQHIRLANQIQAWLQQYFPEYLEVYKKFDTESGLLVLEQAPLPADIRKLGAEEIRQIWKDAKLRGRLGMSRAQTLIEAAQKSVGLEGGEAARFRIRVLISDTGGSRNSLRGSMRFCRRKWCWYRTWRNCSP